MMVIGLVLTGIGLATLGGSNAHSHDAVAHETEAHAAESHQENHGGETAAAHESHEEAHAEAHGNVENEKFGPRAAFHAEEKPAMTRFWANLLVAGFYFLMISLCALFWVAVQYVANAGWSTAIKRVPEAMLTFIPVPFVVLMLAVLVAKTDLYHWAHYEHLHLGPGDAGYDKVLDGKSGFLNSTMLLAFPTILVAIWYMLGRKLRSLSAQEDQATKGDVSFFKKSIRYSAGFAVLFGFTISIIVWLFIMSVDAHWYSTIFGVYNFISTWVTAISIIALFVVYLKKEGYLAIVSDEHIHDLGKFMFAFTIFWAYVWLSQYLLIWYAHIPEEMYYYQIRFEDYKANFLGNLILNFCVPFLFLLMRSAKRFRPLLVTIAVTMCLAHYHDIWFNVFPGVFGPGMQIGVMEVGVYMTFAGLFIYWVLTALTKRGLIAVNHPYIEESAHHDVGV
ncbi:MAG: quinol:cytochrome C oxidoreductase [Bacteroidia bacterium]